MSSGPGLLGKPKRQWSKAALETYLGGGRLKESNSMNSDADLLTRGLTANRPDPNRLAFPFSLNRHEVVP
jgi:hypothetical protein